MQWGNERETSKNGNQEAGKYVGDLFYKYLFDLEHSTEKVKEFVDQSVEYLFDLEHSTEKVKEFVDQSESTKQDILEGGKKDRAFNYTELPKNMAGSSLPPKELMSCSHPRNIRNYGDPKDRTTKADILIKDLIDLRDSNESGDVLFSDLVWSGFERGSRKQGNSMAGRNEGASNLLDIDPRNDLERHGHQSDSSMHLNSKARINGGDFYINNFIDLRDSKDREDLLFSDLVWSSYGKDNSTHGNDTSGINEGEHCLSCIEPVKDLMKNDEKRDCIILGNPNVERIEGDVLIKNLMQSRQEKNSIWIDIPKSQSIGEQRYLISTEPAVSSPNFYNHVEEEKRVNYESMEKPDYNAANTRISSYTEEKDNLLSRISCIFVERENKNVLESAILEENQRMEFFDSDSDSVEISSPILSAEEVSNPYVDSLRSGEVGYLEADFFWKVILKKKDNIEESTSFQELLRKKASDELMVRKFEMQGSANWKGKEKKCDAKSFGNNKSLRSSDHLTIYSSSSSIEDYHLRFASDEDDEEEFGNVLKQNYLLATTLTEKKNNRDVEDDECVILNSNLFHHNNIDIQSKLSLSYNDPSGHQDEEVTVISERGQVACRDYPHSRHHCGKFPFNKTSHDTCCPQCYCYVCDLIAPCKYWSGNSGHCHASDHDPKWKDMRAFQRGLQKET